MARKTIVPIASAAAAGAAAVYLLDPSRGRRRRSLIRDQFVHLGHNAGDGVQTATRDLTNRTRGVFGEARYRLSGRDVDDVVLEARVRSRLGRAVEHPHSVSVTAEDGCVTLTGPVLTRETESMISASSSVPGVREVIDRTQKYATSGDIPSLQGRASTRRLRGNPGNWSPAQRALAGTGGAALAFWGFRRGGFFGIPALLIGAALALRATTNMSFRRLVGAGAGRRAVDIRKAVNINAPVSHVFDIWSEPENFPRFMSHVREVRQGEQGRSHWVVDGPLGARIEWDAEISKYEPDRVLAWRTLPGASVEHAGIIHFDENPDGTTRADVQMSYNPPAGAAGHVVAQLFRRDPKVQMNDDLMRMKTFIETGRVPGDAARSHADAAFSS